MNPAFPSPPPPPGLVLCHGDLLREVDLVQQPPVLVGLGAPPVDAGQERADHGQEEEEEGPRVPRQEGLGAHEKKTYIKVWDLNVDFFESKHIFFLKKDKKYVKMSGVNAFF